MKKGLKILVIMIVTFMSVNYVKAEEFNLTYPDYALLPNSNLYRIINYNFLYEKYTEQVTELYSQAMKKYNDDYKNEYPYYIMYWSADFNDDNFNENSIYGGIILTIEFSSTIPTCETGNSFMCNFEGRVITTYWNETYTLNYDIVNVSKSAPGLLINKTYNYYYYSTLDYFISNFDIYIPSFVNDTYNFNINEETFNLTAGSKLPQFYTDVNPTEQYTEVNLDNYEYVLLSLKDYSQTQAFQTNLQVKGQIGITPIYNYGQTSKDSVTGVQVQDRCNVSYENYTSYPFYIIQSDLQNNVIYAVKECSSGSSFKFDNTIFDITYITTENKDNPTITINGKTYDVIPYGDLPSTATKNEEDNYIPGESGSTTDTGGLDSAIKNVQQRMSEIWNTFTYFTDFVGQLFSSLPGEVQTILLSAFTVGIILGLIKMFIGR